MRFPRYGIVLVLVAGTLGAEAQTLTPRDFSPRPIAPNFGPGPAPLIAHEPMQAHITPGPTGTVVREDEIWPELPVAQAPSAPPAAAARTARTKAAVPPSQGAAKTAKARVAPTRQAASAPKTQRAAGTVKSRQTVARAAPPTRVAMVNGRPNLTPAQRRVLSRAIAQARAVPRTSVAPGTQVVREQVVQNRITMSGEDPVSSAPAFAMQWPVRGSRITTESVVTERDARIGAQVGARLPATVPLYALPASVRTSGLQAYRYAVVNNRILLVDPSTSTVVAELPR
jgi:hypothetical protein